MLPHKREGTDSPHRRKDAMLRQLTTIWKFRYFWLSLVQMDLRVRYRRSLLGIGWSLLNPIAMTAVFCLVFSVWNNNSPQGMTWRDYAPHVLAGLIIWEFITGSATGGCLTFLRNECYLRQCPLPSAIYHLRTVLGSTIHFLIALGVLVVTISVLDRSDPFKAWRVLWAVVPSLVLLLFFCWSVSVLCGYLNVFFHDTQHLLEVFFRMFFFLSPIMYTNELYVKQGIPWMATWSPVVLFFDLIRAPLLTGQLPPAWLYLKATLLVVLAMGLAIGVIAWLEKKLIFRL
jgi:ABC-type polysaccharide/polyol phosphate export permease